MSLSGRLEDVPLVDVLQFVKFSTRTGTLALKRGDERGEISLFEGNIINARAPSSLRLGECLVARGVLDAGDLNRALAKQREQAQHQALGTLLIELQLVSRSDLVEALRGQIEAATYELLSWQNGHFEFRLDDVRPIDELGLSPDELAEVNLNTQHVLLEAAHILDERDRAEEETPTLPPRARQADLTAANTADCETTQPLLRSHNDSEDAADATPPSSRGSGEVRIHLLTADESLASELGRRLGNGSTFVGRVGIKEATKPPRQLPASVLIVDLRGDLAALQRLAGVRVARPNSPIVAIIDNGVPMSAAYAAGATAVVDGDIETICSCTCGLEQHLRELSSERLFAEGLSSAFGKLRRLIGEIRHGVLSATPSLNILHLISESVERAVFLLVRSRTLTCFGGFGQSPSGARLAERIRGLSIPLDEAGLLAACASDAQARSGEWSEAELPDELLRRVGSPKSNRFAIFPVLGGDKVLAVVYADNGDRNWPIEEIEFLELATTQMGLAFENALLRRRPAREGVSG